MRRRCESRWWSGALWTLSATLGVCQSPPDGGLADRGVELVEARDAAVRRAIERALPSVVTVYLMERTEQEPFFGGGRFPQRDRDETELAAPIVGAGVTLDAEGRVLTAFHLLRLAYQFPNRWELRARTPDGSLFLVPRENILAADPRSDLAVFRLVGARKEALKPIEIADGDRLFRGQTVIAIGNPFGVANADGMSSASVGAVSNIGRRAEPIFPAHLQEDNSKERMQHLFASGSLVQIDCRLNMGVSGAPVVDIRGRLVGVAMALAARTGLETPGGFMAPTDRLTRRIVDTLKEGKEVEYGFLGITPSNYTKAEADNDKRPIAEGVRVDNVALLRGGGLQTDDVIVSIDREPTRNKNELVLRVGAMPAGKEVAVKVLRGSRLIDVPVRLGKYPVAGDVIATNRRPLWNGIRVDYASIGVNASRSQFFAQNMPNRGVLITEADSATTAENPELVVGALVLKVNGQNVDDPDAFEKAVRTAKGTVKLSVARMQAGRNVGEWTPVDVLVKPRDLNKKTSAKQANDN